MKQYLKLLMTREAKEVLGKKCANLWLLVLVLTATFLSIAFSEGSMIYLRDKMEDPFTNWVSITKAVDNESFNQFRDALNEESNKEKYDYSGVQMDQYTNYNIMGTDEHHIHYLSVRFFEHINTPLVQAILDESNLVEGCQVDSTILDDKTFGFIITLDAIKRLGYNEKELPTYIHYMAISEGADSLGVKLVLNDYYPLPVPVLAIVRRLPNNVDMMSANYFYEQQHYNDQTHPFDFNSHEEYQHQLEYFVSDDIGREDFEKELSNFIPDSLKTKYQILDDIDNAKQMKSWKPGSMLKVDLGDERIPREIFQAIDSKISSKYDEQSVCRVHILATAEHPSPRSEYISIAFNSLSHIREFEVFAKDNGIQLDMAQVASKENFNAVTVMAAILSIAMVIFAMVCIIMFLVNMLQSYFQKVKRNIGTFKAFGMNGKELIYTYVIILISIVLSAVILALLITYLIQIILPCVGIDKDGFNYFALWNKTTYWAAGIVLIATVLTVCGVMIKMLSQTPGDLIYDRN